VRPRLARGDVGALPFRAASFGVVIAAYGLLQSILTDEGLSRVLADVNRVLEPGGRFGVDLVPDLSAWDEYRRRVRLRGRAKGGATITLVETVRQDRRRRMTIFDEEFARRCGRRTERRRFTLRFRTVGVDEMLSRLAAAGFDVDCVAGDYAGGPWTARSETWLLAARKR
jgi:SAM-dependent methyltransferase